MDELFKEISDSRRIRSQGNTTYLYKGELLANERILRGKKDFEKLKTMGSMAIEGLKNTPDFLFGVSKGILPGMAIGAEETFKTFIPFVNNNVMPWLNENVPGYNSMNEYLNDAFAPEGTAQEIGSSLGEVGGQVVAPGGVYSKAAKMALKPMGYGKNFLANVLGYGTAEFAGMPPEEEGLMEMGIQFFVQNEELKNAMLQSIAADEDASFFLQKIQKAPQRYFEGGLLGEAAEQGFRSLGVLYNAVKGSPNLKTVVQNNMPTNQTRRNILQGIIATPLAITASGINKILPEKTIISKAVPTIGDGISNLDNLLFNGIIPDKQSLDAIAHSIGNNIDNLRDEGLGNSPDSEDLESVLDQLEEIQKANVFPANIEYFSNFSKDLYENHVELVMDYIKEDINLEPDMRTYTEINAMDYTKDIGGLKVEDIEKINNTIPVNADMGEPK